MRTGRQEEMISMIIIGMLIVAAAGSLAGLLIAGNLSAGPTLTLHLLGRSLPALDPVAVLCAGLGLGFAFWLGMWIMTAAVADRRRHPRLDDPVDTLLPGQWRSP